MSNALKVQPDLQFVKDLQAVGGEDVKKCYQCATCSVVCPLSPADNPYPRKEMIWAQWGMKDLLVNDIDIWLCHQCGSCSTQCPRGAKPGDILAALRNMTYRNLVKPAAIGRWMSSWTYLPMLLGLPALLFGIIWLIRAAQLGTFFPLVDGKVVYGALFPGDFTIDPLFGLTALFVVITFAVGISTLIKGWNATVSKTFVLGYKRPTITQAIIDVVKDEIINHAKFRKCGDEPEDQDKFKGHLTLFYGFVCCAIVTSIVAAGHWGGKLIHFIEPIGHTPMALWNPVKVLANVGAILLLVGLTLLTRRRMNLDPKTSSSSYYDWYLLGVIWVIALTGVGAEVLRLAEAPAFLCYFTYYFHLIAVFMMIAYLPWSKLGHLVYRTAALIYARYVGRLPIDEELVKQDNVFIV